MDQRQIGEILKQMSQNEKQTKLERFRRLNPFVRRGQIVFAGSSLMEQFPIYEFLLDDQLPYTIYNRGVGGFTTEEMSAALEECVFALAPAHLFLNIGTNDLNGPDYDEAAMLGRYDDILSRIRERLPETRLYLLAYYPVNPKAASNFYMEEIFRHRTNERIRSANAGVQQLAEKHGAAYLDLNAGITDEAGCLRKEFTVEGMHMYADGYREVLNALLPVLKSLSV